MNVNDDGKYNIRDTVAAVEIKCPFPSERQKPVHYALPDYYVCQCLSEMVALQTDLLIYVSYSQESTTFHKVHFSQSLWDAIWSEVKELYDVANPVKNKKCRLQSKRIKEDISKFLSNNVEFICEIPSLYLTDSGLTRLDAGSPFTYAWPKTVTRKEETTVEKIIAATNRAQWLPSNKKKSH